ncbi:MAG: UDP-glucose 4-epimerase GalE [Magnetococcales bacterium]|nr:UDP-glucose 4-epimerase GalE [Magnetococcales bacterium]
MSQNIGKNTSCILVCGGAGYIGSHVCKALHHAGYMPITYDNLSNGHTWAVRWGPLEKGEMADQHRLEEVMQKYRPEAVMHFAAFIEAGESVKEPVKFYANNTAGSLSLLQAMAKQGINKIVFSSTAAVYGDPRKIPIKENHPHLPINPYGRSKLMVEQMLSDIAQSIDLRYICLRYFNAAGADAESEIGEAHTPETHLIPLILQVASGLRSHISVYGDQYDTQDGTCIRDFIHVSDLAQAHLLAMEELFKKPVNKAYNLGSGSGFSVLEVINMIREVTGHPIPAHISTQRPGDPARLVADSRKIMEELGWSPRYDLRGIIETAWKWMHYYVSNPLMFNPGISGNPRKDVEK